MAIGKGFSRYCKAHTAEVEACPTCKAARAGLICDLHWVNIEGCIDCEHGFALLLCPHGNGPEWLCERCRKADRDREAFAPIVLPAGAGPVLPAPMMAGDRGEAVFLERVVLALIASGLSAVPGERLWTIAGKVAAAAPDEVRRRWKAA